MSRRRRAESLSRRGAVALAGPHSALRASGQSQPGHIIGSFAAPVTLPLVLAVLIIVSGPSPDQTTARSR